MKTVLIPWILNKNDGKSRDRILPLGLMSISAYLKQRNQDVSIFDLNLSSFGDAESAAQLLLKEKADILGFSIAAGTTHHAIQIARVVKKQNPNCIVVFGGPQATLNHESLLRKIPFIDVVIRGEGEITFGDLVCEYEKGAKNLRNVKGITWRDTDGTIICNADRPLICNLDNLPIPDYSAYDIKNWRIDVIPIEIGRGCPFSCSFCASSRLWKRQNRVKSIDRIIEEMQVLITNYQIRHFFFRHDQIIQNRQWFIRLCRRIKEDCDGIKWQCSARIDTIDDELLSIMAECGCEGIEIGIESLSPRIQEGINKHLSPNMIADNLKKVVQSGLNPVLYFMCGFPNETEEDLKLTLNGALQLISSCTRPTFFQMRSLVPFPGTAITEQYKNSLVFCRNKVDADILAGYKPEVLEIAEKDPAMFPEFYYLDNEYGISIQRFLALERQFNSVIRYLNTHYFLSFKYILYLCDWDFKRVFEALNIIETDYLSEHELMERFLDMVSTCPTAIWDLYRYENAIKTIKTKWCDTKYSAIEPNREYYLSENACVLSFSVKINTIIDQIKRNQFTLRAKPEETVLLIAAENAHTVRTYKIDMRLKCALDRAPVRENDFGDCAGAEAVRFLIKKGILV